MSAWEGSDWQAQQEKDKRLIHADEICLLCGGQKDWRKRKELCEKCEVQEAEKEKRIAANQAETTAKIAASFATKQPEKPVAWINHALSGGRSETSHLHTGPLVVATEGQTLVPLDAQEITRLLHALTTTGAHQAEHVNHVLFQKLQAQLQLLNGTDIPLEG